MCIIDKNTFASFRRHHRKSFYDCIHTLLSVFMCRCLVVCTDSYFRFFCHSHDFYSSVHQTLSLLPSRDVRGTQVKPLYRGITCYVRGNCCETLTALDVVHLSSSAIFLRNVDKKRELKKKHRQLTLVFNTHSL